MPRLFAPALAVLLSLQLTAAACASGPSPQLSRYQCVSRDVHARSDVPLFNIRHSTDQLVNGCFELRGMVNGTMVVNGQRSFILQVGQDTMQILLGHTAFDASKGTSIFCVARVLPSGMKVPPDLELLAFVRSEDVVAWEREQERRKEASQGTRHHYVWTAPWPADDIDKQEKLAVAWMQSFNPSLPDVQAHTLADAIFKSCKGYNIDPRFALSLMAAESAFQPTAVSSVGAQGLGQLMPETAARLGVRNAFDPTDNIQGCTKFLNELLAMWGSSKNCLSLVLASYNAGPGAVKQYGGIPPYQETQSYVAYVLSLYRELGGKGISAPRHQVMSTLVTENPFYVLALPVSTSRADIERQGAKLISMLELRFKDAAEYATPLGTRPRTPELITLALHQLRTPELRGTAAVWAVPEPVDPLSAAVWGLIELSVKLRPHLSDVREVGMQWQAALSDAGVAARLQSLGESVGLVGYELQTPLREAAAAWLLDIVEQGSVPFEGWVKRDDMLGMVAQKAAERALERFEVVCERCPQPPGRVDVSLVQQAYEHLGQVGGDTLQHLAWDSLYRCLQNVGRWRRDAVYRWMGPYGERFGTALMRQHLTSLRQRGEQARLISAVARGALLIISLLSLARLLMGVEHRVSPTVLATLRPVLVQDILQPAVGHGVLQGGPHGLVPVQFLPDARGGDSLKDGTPVEILQKSKKIWKVRNGGEIWWVLPRYVRLQR